MVSLQIRSHAILTFHIERRQFGSSPAEKSHLVVGSLQLADLAGIEKLSTTPCSADNEGGGHIRGEYMEENRNINTSLNALGG
jgi:hypothetical protein